MIRFPKITQVKSKPVVNNNRLSWQKRHYGTNKPAIELLAAPTPNGKKVSVMLEELQVPYNLRYIDLKKNEQKENWFLKINPNGKIPAIIDHENGDFPVFESGAILIYLGEKYGKFYPAEPKKKSQVLQWLMFQMSGLGPMQGQINFFTKMASEKVPFAIERYTNETKRLYKVLDEQLKNRSYIVDEISIADFATYPWVAAHSFSGIAIDEFPNIKKWLDTMKARPGVQNGMEAIKPHNV